MANQKYWIDYINKERECGNCGELKPFKDFKFTKFEKPHTNCRKCMSLMSTTRQINQRAEANPHLYLYCNTCDTLQYRGNSKCIRCGASLRGCETLAAVIGKGKEHEST